MNKNLSTGEYGETLAKQFLERHGYKLIADHWQKRVGEIDIIAYDPHHDELVFVEVKTRTNTIFGYPEEKVTKKKLEKINKTAQWFLLTEKYPPQTRWRIDVISIIISPQYQAEVTHFKNISV